MPEQTKFFLAIGYLSLALLWGLVCRDVKKRDDPSAPEWILVMTAVLNGMFFPISLVIKLLSTR